ncbi:hypothetical protein BZA77DRAFT_296430 [Pyronema omphalodes]|nr:hypothetical protein BZA77DRAFT_296430 [Pyronema omphalodes]
MYTCNKANWYDQLVLLGIRQDASPAPHIVIDRNCFDRGSQFDGLVDSRSLKSACWLLNTADLPNFALSLGPWTSAVSDKTDKAVNKKPEAGNKTDEKPTGQNQSAHSGKATDGSQPILKENSFRWKARSLSNFEVGLVLTAADVGGIGPMISAESNIVRPKPHKQDKKQDK